MTNNTAPRFTATTTGEYALALATREDIAQDHLDTCDTALAAVGRWTAIGTAAALAGDLTAAEHALARANAAQSSARHYLDRAATV